MLLKDLISKEFICTYLHSMPVEFLNIVYPSANVMVLELYSETENNNPDIYNIEDMITIWEQDGQYKFSATRNVRVLADSLVRAIQDVVNQIISNS